MKECKISTESTCEEVAEALFINCKLDNEEKDILIKEGISGDVLAEVKDWKSLINKMAHAKRIKSFLDKNKECFKSKEIIENIPIKNEEEIKLFFEKFIGYKGNLDGITTEKELKQLKEEDMNNLGLNFGQRIKLVKYINYFNSLKEKEILITITKDSSDKEALNYLKKELNISDKSIDNLGLDVEIAEMLFDKELFSENDINNCLNDNQIMPNEFEILKKFIEKRDEMMKHESIKISKNSNKEDISKFINEKLSFDLDKHNIQELDLDECKNITDEEREILEKFIEQMKKEQKKINIDNNTIYEETKIGDETYGVIKTKDNKTGTTKKTTEESQEIEYSKKEKEPFQNNSKYNIFFILSTKKRSISNLRFAVFQKKSSYIILSSYFNYEFFLINISDYKNKTENYFILLFQIISDNPIYKFNINVKDDESNSEEPVYQSTEIKVSGETDNFFVLDDSITTYDYFPRININDYFEEYLTFFFWQRGDKKQHY